MNKNFKHIKIFEEIVSNSNESGIFKPLFKLKEVAEQAASLNDYQKGISMIQNYLKDNSLEITGSLYSLERLPSNFGSGRYMINIYHLMLPFIERWKSDILDKELSNDIELNIGDIGDIENIEDTDLDLSDIEIDD